MRTCSALWLIFGTTLLSSFALVGCGDDDAATPAGTSGTAGTAGTGASAGVGGSSGASSGSSGSAGEAGSGGSNGGSSVGGSSGGGTGGSTAGTGGSSGGGTGGIAGVGGTAGGTGGTGGTMNTPKAFLRLAHMVPGMGLVRYCVRAAGAGNYALQTASTFPEGGLPATWVSAYGEVDTTPIDVAVVEEADSSCANPIMEATNLVLEENSHRMLVLSGDAGAGTFKLADYRDLDSGTPSTINIRFVHTATDMPNLSAGAYLGLFDPQPGYHGWTRIFENVSYDNGIGAPNTGDLGLDFSGYAPLPVALASNAPLEIRFAPNGARFRTALVANPQADLGDNVTMFVISTNLGPIVRFCNDSLPTPMGATYCDDMTLLDGAIEPAPGDSFPAPFAGARFAHVSADSAWPSVDVCVKPSYYPDWLADNSQVWVSGLNYKQVTGDVNLPFEDGYDIKLVPHSNGAADCTQTAVSGLADVPSGLVDETTQSTWALLGKTGAPAYAPRIISLSNQVGYTSLDFASIRYVHGIVGIPNTDVGVNANIVWPAVDFATASDYQERMLAGGNTLGLNYQGNASYDLVHSMLNAMSSTTTGRSYSMWGVGDIAVIGGHSLLLCYEDPSVALQTCNDLALTP